MGEPRQARLMSPHVFLTVHHKTTAWFTRNESIYLRMNVSTKHRLWWRVFHYDTFCKVFDVLSEWMVKREELTMFVEQRILATLLQPNESQTFLAYWAWELPVNTTGTEYPIGQEIMQGVVVPNVHLEACLCCSVICPYASSQALNNSSIICSMYTPILLLRCLGIISYKNMFYL